MILREVWREETARAAELSGLEWVAWLPVRINGRLRVALGRVLYGGSRGGVLGVELASSLPEREARDTMRHELAHVIARPEKGHGYHWRTWARRLGCNPSPFCATVQRIRARVGWRCMQCGRALAIGPRSRGARELAAGVAFGTRSGCCHAALARDASADRPAGDCPADYVAREVAAAAAWCTARRVAALKSRPGPVEG